jgi:diguanylate cyclase (GGDEF)-like protein
MTIDHKELSASFESLIKRRNMDGLRLGAFLVTLMFPLFWILDWVTMPHWAPVTFWLRLLGIFYSLAIWVTTIRCRRHISRRTNAVAVSLGLLIGCLIAIMAWLDDGYESPYYAGLNLVILGVSFLFAWPLRLSIGFNVLLYGFYMGPLVTGHVAIDDLGVAISNQFFLLSTILISIVAQQYQLAQERKDFLDIRKHQQLLQHAEILASTDPLTGLYNRRHFFTLSTYELQRALRLDQHLSVLTIDVDYFKQINDTHGHQIGDEILRLAADVFQSNLREQDILARIGGDEFVALLPDTNVQQAASVAERIRQSVQTISINFRQPHLQVTVSIGVAPLATDITDLHSLLLRSDEALYAAKRAGRARVYIWSSDVQPASILAE